MKKFLCLFLAIVLCLSFLVSCDDALSSSKDDGKTDDNSSVLDKIKDFNSKFTTASTTAATTVTTTVPPAQNQSVALKEALSLLLNSYRLNPKAAIPATMLPENTNNLVNLNSIPSDYSSFVSTSQIPNAGVGEQWHMVLDNIEQSQIFFNALSVVDGLTTASVVAYNNFLDSNPSDISQYVYENGIFTITIHATALKLDYVIDYVATDLPIVGTQNVQIALGMDLGTRVKNVRVQLGDAGSLAYTLDSNDSYSFAIEYLPSSVDEYASRCAYFEIEKTGNNEYTGHIYEYFELLNSVTVPSVADFYIANDYVTVVGNKADGMIPLSSYICEIYSVSTGRMIAYEVKEVVYNKIWIDLEHINGINSIKYNEDTEKFYVNGKSSAWEPKKQLLSRKFDIEFRTQYFYYYDADDEKYKVEKAQVPMLFVQEEYYNDLVSDVYSKNNVNISVTLSSADLSKLNNEHAGKIPTLIQNKDKYTVENIMAYIGEPKSFN